MQHAFRHFSFAIFLLPLIAGCSIVGVAAYKLAPPPTIQPKYTNLKDQTVGVMVWADRGIRIDWPTLQLDLANSIDQKFKAETLDEKGKPKAKTLLGVTYPVQPASILRYMRDHPEAEAMQIADIAPKLGAKRLIYVELEDFATRSSQSVDLFRGTAKANVRVYEIGADGKATMAYEQAIAASYPPKSPAEGVPNVGDPRTAAGTIDALATEVVHLFVPYQLEEW